MKRSYNQVLSDFYLGKRINIYYTLSMGRDDIEFYIWQPYEGSYFPAIITGIYINHKNETMDITFNFKEVSIGDIKKSINRIEFGLDREIEFVS